MMKRFIVIFVVLSILLYGPSDSFSQNGEEGQKIWIAPNMPADDQTLFDSQDQWAHVQPQVQVFQFYGDYLKKTDQAILEKVMHVIKANGMVMAVEFGSFSEGECFGIKMFILDSATISSFLQAGGTFDYLILNAPFAHMLEGGKNDCQYSPLNVALEISKYIKAVKKQHPQVKIGWSEPVHWYYLGESFTSHPSFYYGDLEEMIKTLMEQIQKEGLQMDFFHADAPFEYSDRTPQGWEKLKHLQDLVHKHGLRFGLIYHSESGGKLSDEAFYNNILKALEAFRKAGGQPDDTVIQSRFTYPRVLVPESQPYTFMYAVDHFLEKMNTLEEGVDEEGVLDIP